MPSQEVAITDDERQLLMSLLPAVGRESPEGEEIVRRLIQVVDELSAERSYAPITEIAAAFGVTPQTIRNWADRGWLPSHRTPGGSRRIPRGVLASAAALARPRPLVPDDLSPAEVQAVIEAPRRRA